jgi:lysophospholipase L1-like esterase
MKSRVILAILIMALALGSAFAQDPSARHKDYLALGDSVAFGFIDQAGFEYLNPANFVPYADYVGYTLRFTPTDAGCPGETSSSFVSLTGVDHGCHAYRANFPLHVPYSATQLAFATSFLKHNRDTRLVTVNVGANDGFILEESCAGAANPQLCIATGAPQLFATVAQNMQTILAALRDTGFDGPIIIVNYYSLDYSDAGQTTLTAGLNQALAAPASAFGATVADVFSAFQAVVSNPVIAGKTCVAGLLNASPQNQFVCDVHPSQSGHKLIAKTIAATYVALRGHDDD